MSAQMLSSVAGILLALIFAYVPGLKGWYDKQTSQRKALVMLGALVVVSAGSFGLACADWFNVPVTCDQTGIEQLAASFVAALVANQATYLSAVRPFRG